MKKKTREPLTIKRRDVREMIRTLVSEACGMCGAMEPTECDETRVQFRDWEKKLLRIADGKLIVIR